jgi:hypothetical protein
MTEQVICARYSDEEYRRIRCQGMKFEIFCHFRFFLLICSLFLYDFVTKSFTGMNGFAGSSEEYHKRYGKYNIQQIWRDDIFPCRVYLRHWYDHDLPYEAQIDISFEGLVSWRLLWRYAY